MWASWMLALLELVTIMIMLLKAAVYMPSREAAEGYDSTTCAAHLLISRSSWDAASCWLMCEIIVRVAVESTGRDPP